MSTYNKHIVFEHSYSLVSQITNLPQVTLHSIQQVLSLCSITFECPPGNIPGFGEWSQGDQPCGSAYRKTEPFLSGRVGSEKSNGRGLQHTTPLRCKDH